GPMWNIAAAALQGRIVPTNLQGRVNAAYRFLGIGSAALGPILGGFCAQLFGLRVVFAMCAFLTIFMLIPFLLVITEEVMRHTHQAD
ncbi:MAG TPA: MFS transporter, partial [Ktedonobacteraceae bacterium]|nr:MFS transporter [Ktedonobacteraceae bacterium]